MVVALSAVAVAISALLILNAASVPLTPDASARELALSAMGLAVGLSAPFLYSRLEGDGDEEGEGRKAGPEQI